MSSQKEEEKLQVVQLSSEDGWMVDGKIVPWSKLSMKDLKKAKKVFEKKRKRHLKAEETLSNLIDKIDVEVELRGEQRIPSSDEENQSDEIIAYREKKIKEKADKIKNSV